MASRDEIVNYMVAKLAEGGEYLNVLKLHKLLYYSQSWSLAFDRGRLFDGRFQAWVHGPVNRELFDRFRDTKSMYSAVTLEDIPGDFDPQGLDESDRQLVDAVLEVYGPLTGDQLEEMTHREDPWIAARNGLPPSVRSENELDEGLMAGYYKARLNQ
jgi:uncharacterized phage-associated protein